MTLLKRIIAALLTLEARLVLWRYRPHVIAVTGSVGKTSTKDAIYTALSSEYKIRKSEKSFNSELGVPLTILGKENAWRNPVKWVLNLIDGLFLILLKAPYPAWLVLEVGADRPGDIKSISEWLHHEVAVITAIPEIPVHVEFFDSPEAVAAEKRALAEALTKEGILVVNADDPRTRGIAHPRGGKKVTFGTHAEADVRASYTEIIYHNAKPHGMRVTVTIGGESTVVEFLGALGMTQVYPVLASLAVAHALGRDWKKLASNFSHHKTPPGRMRIIAGKNGSTVLDDTYNASPSAADAGLEALSQVTGGKRIAVLGDMLELGKYSVDAHKAIGAKAAACADVLVTLGIRAQGIAEGAKAAGMPEDKVMMFEKSDWHHAAETLAHMISAGDTVLIKGSQGMRMERIVKELMADQAQAKNLLVRQDPEWLAKP